MLRVALLGEQAITDDATGTVRTRSSRTVALVAYLVAHAGTPQPRQLLAGTFWPDSGDAQALTNLRRELHKLRQVLAGDDSLVVTPTDLCWRDTDTCSVDVRAFQRYRVAALAAAEREDGEAVLAAAGAAVAAYRGDLLPAGYDDWLDEVRPALQRQCVELCDLLCQTRARTGDVAGAVQAARRRIQLQPLEEVGYRTLMDLQSELGDRAGAVSTYHRCASLLERELGVLPDAQTQRTLRGVLARGAAAAAPPAEGEPPPGRSGVAAAALVGRDRELGVLRDLWRTAASGRPSLAVVRGGAGVGKSRLVAEVAEEVRRRGALVATSQCFGTSGRLALAPVADWLRHPAVQAAAAGLDPAWRAEVDRLVPAGRGRGEAGAGARAMVDAWQRHRFFEGLARAVVGTGAPVLLVLDNLQWCDAETLAFLTFCFGLLPDARLLVAATLRDDYAGEEPAVADWLVRMRARGVLTDVALQPLDANGTASLATAISGRSQSPADTDLLLATTGGFPLYVIEALRTALELRAVRGPAGLAEVLRNRLDQASPAAREIAGLAAAVGRDASLDLLTEASDLDPDAVVRAVDELWRRRIVQEVDGGYDFSHDLLREAAYAAVSPPKRWLMHRRVAQSLELLHAEDPDSVSAQLAEQYVRGGRPQRAVAHYLRAADVAAGMFAYTEAIRLLTEALSIVRASPAGRESARRELAILEALAAPLNARDGYSSRDLQHTLERSIVLGEMLGRTDSTLTALVGLWASRFVQGRIVEAQQTAARALALVGETSALRGSVHFTVAGAAVNLGRLAEAVRHFELAADLTRGAPSLTIGTRPDVHARAWSAHAQWLLGHTAEARAGALDAVAQARAVNHPYSLAVALAYAGVTSQLCEDRADLDEVVAELSELCARYGFAYYREWALILEGWSRADQPGLELLRRGIDNLKAEGSFARMPYWLSLLADVSARLGQPEIALAVLDAALVAGRARDDLWWLPEVMRMRAAYDEPGTAVTRLRAAAALAAEHGSLALLARCEADLARAGVRLDAAGVPVRP